MSIFETHGIPHGHKAQRWADKWQRANKIPGCKDCKWKFPNGDGILYCQLASDNLPVAPDHFCADGEPAK